VISETARIADQLRRSYYGRAWHGPALSELLSGVTAKQASAKPIAAGHSIHQLVQHVTFWQRLTLGALHAAPIPRDESADWPATLDPWESALTDLRTITDELAAAIDSFPVVKLENIVPGREYSFAFLLHGVVQHNLYHAGQIAILKKAL
jgi:uncharacterized damage-inducible protein DinB